MRTFPNITFPSLERQLLAVFVSRKNKQKQKECVQGFLFGFRSRAFVREMKVTYRPPWSITHFLLSVADRGRPQVRQTEHQNASACLLRGNQGSGSQIWDVLGSAAFALWPCSQAGTTLVSPKPNAPCRERRLPLFHCHLFFFLRWSLALSPGWSAVP